MLSGMSGYCPHAVRECPGTVRVLSRDVRDYCPHAVRGWPLCSHAFIDDDDDDDRDTKQHNYFVICKRFGTLFMKLSPTSAMQKTLCFWLHGKDRWAVPVSLPVVRPEPGTVDWPNLASEREVDCR